MAKTFEFPPFAAIHAGQGDYALSLKGLHPLIQKATIDTGGDPRGKVDPETVFKLTTKCKTCEAILFLTPYFRVVSGSPSIPTGLATARFSLVVDNEIYILDGLLKDHLTDIEGNLLDTAKIDFSKPKKGAMTANMIANKGVVPASTFGYFLADDTPVSIEVRGVAGGYGKFELEAGFVAALYTSQVNGSAS